MSVDRIWRVIFLICIRFDLSFIMACMNYRVLCYLRDPFSDIWQCLWNPEPFHAFRFRWSAKTFNRWLPLNVFAGWLCPTCVTGTWIDVILIWYHYIVICTLVTIFNWWFSSKDMKLQVLIKEVFVVFHWLTFRNTNLPVKAIVRLPHPKSRDNRG